MTPQVISIITLGVLFLFFLFMYVTELLNRRTADRNFEALEEESSNRRNQIANLKNELTHAKDKLVEERNHSDSLAKNLQDEQTQTRKLEKKVKFTHDLYMKQKRDNELLTEKYRIKDEYSQSEFAEQLLFLYGDIPFMVKEIQNNEDYLEQCKQEIPEKFRTTRTGNPRALHMGMRMALKDTKKKFA